MKIVKEEKKLCTRYDFKKILGEGRSNTLFITLRKYHLGEEKMSSSVRGGNRFKKDSLVIRSIIVFNIDECIEFIKKKKIAYENSTYRRPISRITSCYTKIINDLEKVKKYKINK